MARNQWFQGRFFVGMATDLATLAKLDVTRAVVSRAVRGFHSTGGWRRGRRRLRPVRQDVLVGLHWPHALPSGTAAPQPLPPYQFQQIVWDAGCYGFGR